MVRTKFRLSILIVFCFLFILFTPVLAHAEDKLEILTSSAKVQFPSEITFSISARSPVNINDIRLRYKIDQLGFTQIINESYLDFSAAPAVKADWILDIRRTGNIAPGTKIEYWWLLTDVKGTKLETESASVTFDDPRYNWQSSTAGQVTIFWYEGNATFATELLNSSQQAITRLTEGTEASISKPIRLYIYADSDDMRGAMVYSTGWEGGMTYWDYPVVIGAISPSQLAWGKTLIAHELSHMVTRQLTLNTYGNIPTWLHEGISVYAEGQPTNYRLTVLKNAIAEGSLISVMSLTSQFSADPKLATLSYIESYSIVDFLIKTYGQKKISELLEVFKKGSTYDDALQKVYGFDMEGLHAKWLSWVTRN